MECYFTFEQAMYETQIHMPFHVDICLDTECISD